MQFFKKDSELIKLKAEDQNASSEKLRVKKTIKGLVLSFFRLAVLIGVSYVILSPLIEIFSNSFFSDSDATDPMVYVIPKDFTLEKYSAFSFTCY